MAVLANRSLTQVPGLDSIAADPRCLVGLSKATVVSLLMRNAVVQSALAAALASDDVREQPAVITEDDDRWLTPDEAAVILRRDRQWIYRRKKTLPFVKRVSARGLLCSEAGIKRW